VFVASSLAQSTNPSPGDEKWRIPTTATLSGGLILGTNGLVYAATSDKQLYAWEASSGTLRWHTNFSSLHWFSGPLAVGPEGNLYVMAAPGLHALNGETGTTLWTKEAQSGCTVAIGPDGTVYTIAAYALYGTADFLYALDPATGAVRWEWQGSRLSGVPALSANGMIFVVSAHGKVISIDTHTGQRIWEFVEEGVDFASVIAAGDGTVLAIGSGSEVVALEGITGERLWNFRAEGISNTLIGPGGTIYVATYSGLIHVLDVASGDLERELSLPFPLDYPLLLTADGALYLGNGNLYALNLASKARSRPWSASQPRMRDRILFA